MKISSPMITVAAPETPFNSQPKFVHSFFIVIRQVEMEEKAKFAEEMTKKKLDEDHAKSIMLAFLDEETLKYTAQHQDLYVAMFKIKVLEFDDMQIFSKRFRVLLHFEKFEFYIGATYSYYLWKFNGILLK